MEPRDFYEYRRNYETLLKEMESVVNGEILSCWDREEVCWEFIVETLKVSGKDKQHVSSLQGQYHFCTEDNSFLFWDTKDCKSKKVRMTVRITSNMDDQLVNLWSIGHVAVLKLKDSRMKTTAAAVKDADRWVADVIRKTKGNHKILKSKDQFVIHESCLHENEVLDFLFLIERSINDDDHLFCMTLSNQDKKTSATLSVRTNHIEIVSKELLKLVKTTYDLEA